MTDYARDRKHGWVPPGERNAAPPWPWWTMVAQGRVYRPVMRLMHWFGWCYPVKTMAGTYWCHWYGLRGQR